MNFIPRDYQLKAHTLLEENVFNKGLKTLLVMPTGAGKSKTAMSFVKKHIDNYNFVVVVRTRDLVNQLIEDAELFNLNYGVYMAEHGLYNPHLSLQLCSVDTLNSRKNLPHLKSEKTTVLLIDEADQSKSEGYQEIIKSYCHYRSHLIGMTATPYNGLDHFDTWIEPITAKELKARGILVDYDYFLPKTSIDLSDVEIVNGEFISKQVAVKMNTIEAVKACFTAWLNLGEDRQTLIFCVNQDHAKDFCLYINAYYNKIVAVAVDSNTPEDERKKVYEDFSNGRIKFLLNVRLITRGVNLPVIGCILDTALTLQINLHIQKIGRGSRENDFYDNCLLIDCVGNLINNGHFYQERSIDLSDSGKRSKEDLENIVMRRCDKCFRAGMAEDFVKNTCPYCGYCNAPLPVKKISKAQQVKMQLDSMTEEQIEQQQMIKYYKKLLWRERNLFKQHKMSIPNAHKMSIPNAHKKMLKKYGVKKCRSIAFSLGLSEKDIERWEAINNYKPLGGMLF